MITSFENDSYLSGSVRSSKMISVFYCILKRVEAIIVWACNSVWGTFIVDVIQSVHIDCLGKSCWTLWYALTFCVACIGCRAHHRTCLKILSSVAWLAIRGCRSKSFITGCISGITIRLQHLTIRRKVYSSISTSSTTRSALICQRVDIRINTARLCLRNNTAAVRELTSRILRIITVKLTSCKSSKKKRYLDKDC